MEIFLNPSRAEWPEISRRALPDDSAVEGRVREILDAVRERGDDAVREIALKVEGYAPEDLRIDEQTIAAAAGKLPESLKEAMRCAYHRISEFHARQMPGEVVWDDGQGIVCRRRQVPIHNVGLYVPGGSAPLFSTVLMLCVPAKLAGCTNIVLCTPTRGSDGPSPAILYAASLCGVTQIYGIGGAQAIAAMAYGTQSVPKVDKIFGPGNRYVLKAKQAVSREGVAIDMPAGPSEVMVLADGSAVPQFVAADLLSQAEHGPDSQAMLVCEDAAFADAVMEHVRSMTAASPRRDIIEKALAHSRAVVLADRSEMTDFANAYAAEHLILSVKDAEDIAVKIYAAGSVFIGNYAPESAGDYASGTNHTLPTSGLASAWSGLGLDSFMHGITFQSISREGLAGIAPTIIEMAEAEGLYAHAEAVKVRL